MANLTYQPNTGFDLRDLADRALRSLKRDRDRQVLTLRYGLGMAKRQTLEAIGQSFGITRERVRQIEKAAQGRLKNNPGEAVNQANQYLAMVLKQNGGAMGLGRLAAALGSDPDSLSYLDFLASLSPDILIMEESDNLRTALVHKSQLDGRQVKRLADDFMAAVKKLGQPAPLDKISRQMSIKAEPALIGEVAYLCKHAAHLDNLWGLASDPHVNPKSIRDKTYVVLKKHAQPLHFSDIADKIQGMGIGRRQVTVQAVHNELIKDPRFILIGRGIYALAEWGYTPGTVADIIIDVLRTQQPLHRDEIVRRVLQKRQVKTTTIILNLQEKKHFDRVAKATYKLKES